MVTSADGHLVSASLAARPVSISPRLTLSDEYLMDRVADLAVDDCLRAMRFARIR